jgi:GrpB-like predicted nucleotidyltransferase (UPF0157 family)
MKAEQLTGKVKIVSYDPEWPRKYEQQSAMVRRELGAAALAIDHVGSTSVPGLSAKATLDIILTVDDSSREDTYAPALIAAGFSIAVREPEWFEHRMFKYLEPATNLHVFSLGCPEIERMKRFRDWLCANEGDRNLYEQTKLKLSAAEWKFMQDYADAKAHVVSEIMKRAGTD